VAALPYPKYGIDKLYVFPYYQTRDAYERATGQPCPAWNPKRRPQKWCDPAAANDPDDYVIYERALATDMNTGRALAGTDGKPYMRRLLLPRDMASTVNIAPDVANVEGAGQPEYPCPLRALEPGEELFFDMAGFGTPAVKNTELYGAIESGFNAADRALLKAIAQKLGL
jgi:hypothetical protein